jgi:hypothetical protein
MVIAISSNPQTIRLLSNQLKSQASALAKTTKAWLTEIRSSKGSEGSVSSERLKQLETFNEVLSSPLIQEVAETPDALKQAAYTAKVYLEITKGLAHEIIEEEPTKNSELYALRTGIDSLVQTILDEKLSVANSPSSSTPSSQPAAGLLSDTTKLPLVDGSTLTISREISRLKRSPIARIPTKVKEEFSQKISVELAQITRKLLEDNQPISIQKSQIQPLVKEWNNRLKNLAIETRDEAKNTPGSRTTLAAAFRQRDLISVLQSRLSENLSES